MYVVICLMGFMTPTGGIAKEMRLSTRSFTLSVYNDNYEIKEKNAAYWVRLPMAACTVAHDKR